MAPGDPAEVIVRVAPEDLPEKIMAEASGALIRNQRTAAGFGPPGGPGGLDPNNQPPEGVDE